MLRRIMRVLALEPYYGGSHRAFLDGWIGRSRHEWTLLTLPPNKWKWRMRHAAIDFAEEAGRRVARGERFDIIFCSDMLNLAEFLGLAPFPLRCLPGVAYFHENQLTYPVRHESERDYHFVITNLTTALAATQVWFNSAYHRDSFLQALPAFFKKMPDYRPLGAIDRIRANARIEHPGIAEPPARPCRQPGPLRILWAARWEHDKNPEAFFDAIDLLQISGADFRLNVIGEQFREQPDVFEQAHARHVERIDRWGFQPSRSEYDAALREADVIVSTAEHEFFGLSVVEAVAAGAYPLLPWRLAYPELLNHPAVQDASPYFYDGSAEQLADRLSVMSERRQEGALDDDAQEQARRAIKRFFWAERADRMDAGLEQLADRPNAR